jgi:hypothetical protein
MPTSVAGPSLAPAEDSRPEAGPLPRKIAEFGYVPVEGGQQSSDANAPVFDVVLPPHPAERSAIPSSGIPPASSSNDHVIAPAGASSSSLPLSVNSSKRSQVYRRFINFLHGGSHKPMPHIWGIEPPTLIRLAFTIVILAGVIVTWALTVVFVSKQSRPPPPTPPGKNGDHDGNDSNDGTTTSNPGSNSPFSVTQDAIFIHAGFGMLTLVLLILLERAVFIARAERYAFKHPNANGRRGRIGVRGGVALAPWNRPPLPTYASAMGYTGTGDVEDAQIAGPPPPEYGNTRGSTLLLSTYLGGSQSDRNVGNGESDAHERVAGYNNNRRADAEVAIPDRAVSRTSRLSSSSIQEDAGRARRLEHALAALEGGQQSSNANVNANNVSPAPRALRLARR